MKPRFLFDEHVPSAICKQLRRLDSQIEALTVGEPGVPPKGTLDFDLLIWLEKHNYVLVTENRRTMAIHIQNHYAAGGRVTGILWIRPSATIGQT